MTKSIILNPLNLNQRRLFQIGIVSLLLVFFVTLFFIFRNSATKHSSSVILQDSTLQVFDKTYNNFDYPDRISVHYPYLLVVEPTKTTTTVYNLEKKEKVAQFKQVLLDYDGKNTLYNEKQTFFNNTNLGVLCESGFMKSNEEVLCAVSSTSSKSRILSVDTKSKTQKPVYETSNLITYVTLINGKIYVGEIDTETNSFYLMVKREKIKIATPIQLVYTLDNEIFVASFRSVFTNEKIVNYKIERDKAIKLSEEEIVIAK